MAVVSNGTTLIDAGALGASAGAGKLTLIKTLTASSSSTLSFVHGASSVVFDGTYDSYIFKFIDIHPSADISQFSFNMSTNGGSNYNVTKTSSSFRAYHSEDDAENALAYFTNMDLAQSTSFQPLTYYSGIQNDASNVGTLQIFDPSDTTFVKHFISVTNEMSRESGGNPPLSHNFYISGYGNTTSAVNAIQFKFSSGNIDAGTIKLYGVG